MTAVLIVNILGWTGAVVILLAYILVSLKKVEGDSDLFQILNLVGAALLVVNALHFGAYPSVGVNAVWSVIAICALIRGRRGGREAK